MTDRSVLSDDTRLYIIGDIHGRSELLDRMTNEIERDLAQHPADAAVTVTTHCEKWFRKP